MEKKKSDTPSVPEKKRRRRKEKRPAEIIEAGFLEFAENGFAGTRLSDVALRAGVVKGTIYRYFHSKEALFQAAVSSRIVSTLDHVEDLVDNYPGPTDELLKLVLQTIYEKIIGSDARILIHIVIAEGARFPEIPAYYHQEVISKATSLLDHIVRRGIERGEFRDGPAAKVPIILMAPAILAAVWKLTFEQVEPLALGPFIEAHMDIILNGLRA